MWFIGIIAGLFIGALFQSVPAALVLAVVGAFALPQIVRRKKSEPHRTDAERVPAAIADQAAAPAGGALKLQQRVSELEQRVAALELRLAQGPAAEASAIPELSSGDLATSMTEAPLP